MYRVASKDMVHVRKSALSILQYLPNIYQYAIPCPCVCYVPMKVMLVYKYELAVGEVGLHEHHIINSYSYLFQGTLLKIANFDSKIRTLFIVILGRHSCSSISCHCALHPQLIISFMAEQCHPYRPGFMIENRQDWIRSHYTLLAFRLPIGLRHFTSIHSSLNFLRTLRGYFSRTVKTCYDTCGAIFVRVVFQLLI